MALDQTKSQLPCDGAWGLPLPATPMNLLDSWEIPELLEKDLKLVVDNVNWFGHSSATQAMDHFQALVASGAFSTKVLLSLRDFFVKNRKRQGIVRAGILCLVHLPDLTEEQEYHLGENLTAEEQKRLSTLFDDSLHLAPGDTEVDAGAGK